MSFVVVIPVYNHARTLHQVVRDTRRLGFPIVIVDDGSTDDLPHELVLTSGVHLLRHKTNQGKGAALISGFQAAAAAGARWAITLDADGQHHPQDAAALIKAIPESQRAIIVGCRQGMLDAGAPWTSRFGREFSNFWIRMSGGPPTKDTQSGFRIYPLPEVLALGVKARRYQFEVEVLVKANQKGIQVIEAPINVTYQSPGERVSHFRPFVDFMRNSETFTRLIVQRVFNAWRGRCH